jgi:hypothetical protein
MLLMFWSGISYSAVMLAWHYPGTWLLVVLVPHIAFAVISKVTRHRRP